jgi:hypothetical protein
VAFRPRQRLDVFVHSLISLHWRNLSELDIVVRLLEALIVGNKAFSGVGRNEYNEQSRRLSYQLQEEGRERREVSAKHDNELVYGYTHMLSDVRRNIKLQHSHSP